MSNIELIKSLYKANADSHDNNKKNVVIYTRVSTKEQAENNDSLEIQLKYCKQYADKNGYNVLGEFGRKYESAKSDARKEFQRMLSFVRSSTEKINYIIVYSIDRFSRTGGAAISVADELRKMGVHIIACTQPTDTKTSSGTFQQNIQFLFGQYDNELRKEKCVAGSKEKLLNGYWMGKAPIGYVHAKELGEQKLVINNVGEIIRKAFLLKVEQGLTNYEISMRCKSFGHFINEKRLFDIFRNPFYCGYIKNRLLGNEIVKGRHEPLISEEVFLKANNIGFDQAKTFVKKNNDDIFPLKRFVKCDYCGTTCVGYSVVNKKAIYYKCNKRGCRHNRNADIMHSSFNEYLSNYTIPEKYIEPLKLQLSLTFKALNKDSEVTKILLRTKLHEAQDNLFKVQERYALGKIEDDEVYKRITAKFNEEISHINNELKKTELKLSNLDNFVHYSVKLSSKLNVMWTSGSFEIKQGLQNLIFPEGVSYDFQNNTYRTCKMNSVFSSISEQSRLYQQEEFSSPLFLDSNSGLVVPTGIEPVSKV